MSKLQSFELTCCLHISSALDLETQVRVKKSLNDRSNELWIFENHREDSCSIAKFCFFIDADIEIYENLFALLSDSENNLDQKILYFDYEIYDKFNKTNLPAVMPPEYSIYRLLQHNYLGPLLVKINKNFGKTDQLVLQDYSSLLNSLRKRDTEACLIQGISYAQRDISEAFLVDSHASHIDQSEIRESFLNNFPITEPISVSIIIPTRGTVANGKTHPLVFELLQSCTNQITTSLDIEIVIVYDEISDLNYLNEIKSTFSELNLKFIPYNEPFNFSKKCNLGALNAAGDVIAFLNDDTYWISMDGIQQLARIALANDVGAVGAKLYFENGLLQHSGMITVNGAVGHAYFKEKNPIGYFGDTQLVHEAMGVTGACLFQRKSVWKEIGGWDVEFANSYNDVDYCFKIRNSGLRILQNNYVELYHYESLTRDTYISENDFNLLNERWKSDLARDKYFRQLSANPRISISGGSAFKLRLKQANKIFKNYGFFELINRVIRFFRNYLNSDVS